MNHPRIHSCINWCAIILFLIPIVTTTTAPTLWEYLTLSPPFLSLEAYVFYFLTIFLLKIVLLRRTKNFSYNWRNSP